MIFFCRVSGFAERILELCSKGGKGKPMTANQPQTRPDRQRLRAIDEQLVSLLGQLDALELHRAASLVSAALDSIRRDHPELAPFP
jgi:hypothetical protein